jgi:aspartate carbamoyltransferase catalytic subunit
MTGRILSNVFLDLSREHTRLSFNSAWLRLGGSLLNFERSIDQITRKRHAPDELAEVCSNYSDITVLRTQDADTFSETLSYFQIPVVNAGNGMDEHPTHAMADLYTLFKWRPELLQPEVAAEKRLQIGIGGDPSNTRTLRSFLYALAQFPWAVERVVIFERLVQTLTPEQRSYLAGAGLKIEVAAQLYPKETLMGVVRKLVPEMDVIYLHYLRPVTASRLDLVDSVSGMNPHTLVFNPQIQTEEFARILNDSPHNGYFAQTRGSVFIRMALFSAILNSHSSA